jgi:hypothetical protein
MNRLIFLEIQQKHPREKYSTALHGSSYKNTETSSPQEYRESGVIVALLN